MYKGASVLDDGSPGAAHRCLLHLSRGGADAVVVREFNLAARAFVPSASGGFVLPEAKTSVRGRVHGALSPLFIHLFSTSRARFLLVVSLRR